MYTVPQCSTSTNEYLSVFHSDYSVQTRSALACTVLVGCHQYCTVRLTPVLYCLALTSTVGLLTRDRMEKHIESLRTR